MKWLSGTGLDFFLGVLTGALAFIVVYEKYRKK